MKKDIKFIKYQKRGAYHWQQAQPSIFNFSAFVLARYQQVVNAIPQTRNQKVLDIGCGDGVLTWLIYQKTKCDIIGIDTDSSAIEFAKKETIKRQAKVKFLVADANQLPFKPNRFDAIVLAEVIEHLANPKKLLSETIRVLKSSGQVIITTPVKLSPVPKDKMHVKEFTPEELKSYLQKYFKSVSIKTSHPLWLTKLYLWRLAKFGRFHFEPFRWLINLWVILTKLNPFKLSLGVPTNQIAICRNPV